jgi:hypothetical protein
MGNKRIILFFKRFRPKAPSAASLSLGRLVECQRSGFDFLLTPYYEEIVFKGEEGMVFYQ